jgi:hypothetical protein
LLLKVFVVVVLALIALVAALPFLLATGFVRERIARAATDVLGAKVAIGDYGFSWHGSVEAHGITIDNPAGFAQDAPLFRMRAMQGGVSLSQLVRGRVQANGVIDSLELRVVQKADGTTNVMSLGGKRVTVQHEPGSTSTEVDVARDLANLRVDFRLRDSTIEVVHEQHGTLERMSGIEARLAKEFGTSTFRIEFRADLGRPGVATLGRIELSAAVDADPRRPLSVEFDCQGLDLARYGPVLALFVPQDQVTAFAGVVEGKLRVRGAPADGVATEGAFDVHGPHFAGPLFAGMDIRAPRWTFTPNLRAVLREGMDVPDVDAAGLALDLGFLTAHGVPTELPAHGGARPLAVEFDLDVAKLADYGGSIPAELRGSATRVAGTVTVPVRTDWASLSVEQMIAAVRLDAALSSGRLVVAEQVLEGLGGRASLEGGKLRFSTGDGARIGGGLFGLSFDADLGDLAAPPIGVELKIGGAQVAGNAVQGLRYFVPVLAGLAAEAGLDFQSSLDFQIAVRGPARPREGESILEWLNQWEGRGALGLARGAFTPAQALAQILTLTGQKSRLEFDGIDTGFSVSKGFITTELMKLAARGRVFALQGKTSLAGDLEHTIDVKDMLKDVPNADQVLKYLGDRGLEAKLAGTLDSPRLALPDLQKLLQDAAKGALEQQAKDLLKGVIPGAGKKDGEEPPPVPDPAELLKRLLPGKKQ